MRIFKCRNSNRDFIIVYFSSKAFFILLAIIAGSICTEPVNVEVSTQKAIVEAQPQKRAILSDCDGPDGLHGGLGDISVHGDLAIGLHGNGYAPGYSSGYLSSGGILSQVGHVGTVGAIGGIISSVGSVGGSYGGLGGIGHVGSVGGYGGVGTIGGLGGIGHIGSVGALVGPSHLVSSGYAPHAPVLSSSVVSSPILSHPPIIASPVRPFHMTF